MTEASGESSASRATPGDARSAARRRYLAGERVDMRALALELGVSRPTLYRWTGGREQLISDVLDDLSEAQFRRAERETADLEGPARLIAHFRRYVSRLVSAPPLATFLRQEPQAALRILTARDSTLQSRTVARLADLYREEQRRGAFHPTVEIDTLAYAVVKVTEAFIYNDALLAVEPEVDHAAEIVALLLVAGAIT